ncbi:hypothetical protein BMS3Abin09_01173 [bacterium BMS3Abin09]|nr:hypothetical protein BMS3Abin09_01173 [bacterium BMS3Abin09]GBE40851.1 hypothetical protein BMS3Bbin09_00737 [bacterium BMS3Bbin09]
MIVVLLISCCSSPNPASMILRCVSISPGFPSGFPAENFVETILGGLASPVISGLNEIQTVLIPAFSMFLAISPTDWLQRIHVGVRKTISTPLSLSIPPSFAEFFNSLSVLKMCPMKL